MIIEWLRKLFAVEETATYREDENERSRQAVAVLKPPPPTKHQTISKSPTVSQLEHNNPEWLKITDDFRHVFEIIEEKNISVFLTGKAGTGKSTFIDYFRANTNKNIVCLAYTGVAALNIGGKTIHSLFHFPTKAITEEVIDRMLNNERYNDKNIHIIKKIDTIIIDEVSMVRVDLLEGIHWILQKYRDKTKPFGGVQMVFVGDLYQLSPVVDDKKQPRKTEKGEFVHGKPLNDYLQDKYGGKYFFDSNAFKKLEVLYFELKDMFRQKDEHFLNILNQIRENIVTDKLLDDLNSRCDETEDTERIGEERIYLCTRNDIANKINHKKMETIDAELFSYPAEIEGEFTKLKEDKCPAPSELKLKVGAQVMMIKNNIGGHWVNGTIGRVHKLSDSKIEVEIHGKLFAVDKETWELFDYQYNKKTCRLSQEVVGEFIQYPIRPAWAITIHKSQGKTFEKVTIDLGEGAFGHGQTYVALSRCRTLEGIILKRPIRRQDIKVDDKVVDFIKTMEQKTKQSDAVPMG